MKWLIATALLFSLCFSQAQAQAVIATTSAVLGCKLTPTIAGADGSYPGLDKIVRSNKLARPAGKVNYAQGQLLYFVGKVLDERCIPVEGAHIELWQADTSGKYKWSSTGDLLSPSPAFAGSGKAVTNNLGEFEFETVFPGGYASRAPHLHVRITHPHLVPLVTEIFFDRDERNAADPKLRSIAPDLRKRVTARMNPPEVRTPNYLTAYSELVLRGKEKFTEY